MVSARLRDADYDVVLATAPPIAAALAARLAKRRGVPLVVELRDLWAGNPAYDASGRLLTAVESRLLQPAAAVIAVTPEAALDLARRHPELAGRVVTLPNGFEPELLERRLPDRPLGAPIEILHSGTLLASRPLGPLLSALARQPPGSFRLVLHGYLSPESAEEIARAPAGVEVEVAPPSTWEDAVERIASADVCLVTQSRDAGDATAVAGKVYEYLALGRPVLCLSHGGATSSLLRRLGAGGLAVDLDDDRGIDAALARLRTNDLPPAVAPAELLPYSRAEQASQLAELLTSVAQRSFVA
jgi:glycosyltransferase involved in cell wall biosynthesis